MTCYLAAALGFTGTISNIEYRGGSVKLSVDGAGIEDFTAIIADGIFHAQPVAVGDAVPLNWQAEDTIVLGRPAHRSPQGTGVLQ